MGEGEKPAVKPDQTKCSCKSSALDSEDIVSKAMVINLVQMTVPFMNIIKATPYAPEHNSHRTTHDEKCSVSVVYLILAKRWEAVYQFCLIQYPLATCVCWTPEPLWETEFLMLII